METRVVCSLLLLLFTPSSWATEEAISDIITRRIPEGPIALVDGVAIGRDEFLYAYKAQVKTRTGVSDAVRVRAL